MNANTHTHTHSFTAFENWLRCSLSLKLHIKQIKHKQGNLGVSPRVKWLMQAGALGGLCG